jgi:hypothetical protein
VRLGLVVCQRGWGWRRVQGVEAAVTRLGQEESRRAAASLLYVEDALMLFWRMSAWEEKRSW